jgi:hypothetical protein
MTTETQWSGKFVEAVRKQGWMARSLTGGTDGSGWPDKVFILPLGTFWVEFKNVTTPVEPHQMSLLRKLSKRLPGFVFLARKENSRHSRGRLLEPISLDVMGTFDGPSDFVSTLLKASQPARQRIEELGASAALLLSESEKRSSESEAAEDKPQSLSDPS